jgi:hypothetical protein
LCSPASNKPLQDWTSEEVDNWIKGKFPDLVYEHERTKQKVSILSLVSGKKLSDMTAGGIKGIINDHIVHYKTLTSETGALAEPLYLAIQDLKKRFSLDPWAVVRDLGNKLKDTLKDTPRGSICFLLCLPFTLVNFPFRCYSPYRRSRSQQSSSRSLGEKWNRKN